MDKEQLRSVRSLVERMNIITEWEPARDVLVAMCIVVSQIYVKNGSPIEEFTGYLARSHGEYLRQRQEQAN